MIVKKWEKNECLISSKSYHAEKKTHRCTEITDYVCTLKARMDHT